MEVAGIEASQAAVMEKLRSLETEKVQRADREAARAAALAHQIELEKEAQERVRQLRAQPRR
jgi:hypothetical protein